MDKKYYMAPMEGVTDSIYRKTFARYYGGVDKYFTPFVSPNETYKWTTREWKELNPEANDINITVPQILTNKPEHFLWAYKEIASLGYKEINFNLGCPSGTVVAKKKGSGLLYYPDELDKFLYNIFDGISKYSDSCAISIKTRLAKDDPEDFYEILDIYNKYPIYELTVHPRITTDFYKEPVRMGYFDYAYKNAKARLVYNGEIHSLIDAEAIYDDYSELSAVMIGRGIISNPALLLKNDGFNIDVFRSFHSELLETYKEVLSGDTPVLHRMKEFWFYWDQYLQVDKKLLKGIKKASRIADYNSSVESFYEGYRLH